MVQKERQYTREEQSAIGLIKRLSEMEAVHLRHRLAQVEATFPEMYQDACNIHDIVERKEPIDETFLSDLNKKYDGGLYSMNRGPIGQLFYETCEMINEFRKKQATYS